LIHSLAHIELNAINLSWDIIARFSAENLPIKFYNDWIKIAKEESEHFSLLNNRLKSLNSYYGSLVAHGEIWELSAKTNHNLLVRLAVIPMVLEARGLDATPLIIEKLNSSGDKLSSSYLKKIYEDEINHVAIGEYWFRWMCILEKKDPKNEWMRIVKNYIPNLIKPPLNLKARKKAGISEYMTDYI